MTSYPTQRVPPLMAVPSWSGWCSNRTNLVALSRSALLQLHAHCLLILCGWSTTGNCRKLTLDLWRCVACLGAVCWSIAKWDWWYGLCGACSNTALVAIPSPSAIAFKTCTCLAIASAIASANSLPHVQSLVMQFVGITLMSTSKVKLYQPLSTMLIYAFASDLHILAQLQT